MRTDLLTASATDVLRSFRSRDLSPVEYPAGVDYTVEPFILDGAYLDTFHDVCPAEIFDVTSRCPVLAVPAGRSAEGVPVGVEIVGRPFDDHTVFRIGAAIEAGQPWSLVAELGS